MEKLFDVYEVAEICGISRNTVRSLIAQGTLPAYKLGPRLVRVKQSDLEAALTRFETKDDAEVA